MKNKRTRQPDFKATQIYGWDEEPVDERPSEFSSTRGHSVLPGYYHSTLSRPPAPARAGRVGFKSMIGFCCVLIALGGVALVKLAPLLRA